MRPSFTEHYAVVRLRSQISAVTTTRTPYFLELVNWGQGSYRSMYTGKECDEKQPPELYQKSRVSKFRSIPFF
jgi:hypothetical protein